MGSFGPHVTYDMRGCDKEVCQDLNEIFDFLNVLPQILGMTIIDPPKVIKYKGLIPEDWGCTGSVTIAESHCSLHSFVDREQYVFLDIFSCKPFNLELADKLIKETFNPKHVKRKVTKRGLDFPRGN